MTPAARNQVLVTVGASAALFLVIWLLCFLLRRSHTASTAGIAAAFLVPMVAVGFSARQYVRIFNELGAHPLGFADVALAIWNENQPVLFGFHGGTAALFILQLGSRRDGHFWRVRRRDRFFGVHQYEPADSCSDRPGAKRFAGAFDSTHVSWRRFAGGRVPIAGGLVACRHQRHFLSSDDCAGVDHGTISKERGCRAHRIAHHDWLRVGRAIVVLRARNDSPQRSRHVFPPSVERSLVQEKRSGWMS